MKQFLAEGASILKTVCAAGGGWIGKCSKPLR
jgi:hypothetical protein